MPNERLRGALVREGLTIQTFSDQLAVDPKTVERWITQDRTPHRRHRLHASSVLGRSDAYLWPATRSDSRSLSASQAELVQLHANRGSVPTETWVDLIEQAGESIDVLAYAASFLHDTLPALAEQLAGKARAGVRVRLSFGDPSCAAVQARGAEEGIGELLAARCRLTWAYLADVLGEPGLQARQHSTNLYASLFRFDDTLLVNPHAYGSPASHSPLLHLNRIPGGRVFDHYLESFQRVWETADEVELKRPQR